MYVTYIQYHEFNVGHRVLDRDDVLGPTPKPGVLTEAPIEGVHKQGAPG